MIKIKREVVDTINSNPAAGLEAGQILEPQAIAFGQNEFGEEVPEVVIFEGGQALPFINFFEAIPHKEDGEGNYIIEGSYIVESTNPLKLIVA